MSSPKFSRTPVSPLMVNKKIDSTTNSMSVLYCMEPPSPPHPYGSNITKDFDSNGDNYDHGSYSEIGPRKLAVIYVKDCQTVDGNHFDYYQRLGQKTTYEHSMGTIKQIVPTYSDLNMKKPFKTKESKEMLA
ncbi:hypothetical protein M9H77_13774 [Catharanthus roseus]|uniref:Uncharacterized protein n=1 Tax=Catharanthus roseus TaxID=4058 RepID=A0ACC0BLB1_CATRO|nr:hypothetical protein M9H77_13774 [Catharanthus roseus]